MVEDLGSEKDVVWAKAEEEVNNIIDGLGLGIDNNIKGVVASFRVHGFPTTGSCEGHPDDKEHGNDYPWIEICADEPDGWRESEVVQNQWRAENLRQRSRVEELLVEFYGSRSTSNSKLILINKGIYGAFRIQGSSIEGKSLEDPEEQHKRQLDEMNAFSDFLKEKFLSES